MQWFAINEPLLCRQGKPIANSNFVLSSRQCRQSAGESEQLPALRTAPARFSLAQYWAGTGCSHWGVNIF